MPDLSVSIEIRNLEDAKTLAVAVQVLRWYGMTYDDEQAIRIADEATEALQNLDVSDNQN